VAVLIGQLGQGGSERQLYLFLAHCDRTRWAPVVYVSGFLGCWETPIRSLGVPVVLLRGGRLAKMRQLRSACIAQKARCFFSWSSYTNGFAVALAGCGVHCIGSFRNELFADLPARHKWLWSRISLAGISTAVCNSREAQTQMACRRGSRVKAVFVPNAVEILSSDQVKAWRKHWRGQLGLSEDTVLVLGVGRLDPQKQFSRFIDAIARVGQELRVHAVIAGEDRGWLADLEERLVRLGLRERIRFIGGVPDARTLMCAADIFMLSSEHEGMPNVVLEAMAAGVPCVATKVNGVGDLIKQSATGFIAERSAGDLAQHVARLAADPDLRRMMGTRARAVIEEKFVPQQIVPQLWGLCERHDD
jgi:glycosyltransferase involved in cell wall biosynthesis